MPNEQAHTLQNFQYAVVTSPWLRRYSSRNIKIPWPFFPSRSRNLDSLQILIPILLKFQENVEQCGADVTFGRLRRTSPCPRANFVHV